MGIIVVALACVLFAGHLADQAGLSEKVREKGLIKGFVGAAFGLIECCLWFFFFGPLWWLGWLLLLANIQPFLNYYP
jgi:hypothetical protein